jgi:hypothetical protein
LQSERCVHQLKIARRKYHFVILLFKVIRLLLSKAHRVVIYGCLEDAGHLHGIQGVY